MKMFTIGVLAFFIALLLSMFVCAADIFYESKAFGGALDEFDLAKQYSMKEKFAISADHEQKGKRILSNCLYKGQVIQGVFTTKNNDATTFNKFEIQDFPLRNKVWVIFNPRSDADVLAYEKATDGNTDFIATLKVMDYDERLGPNGTDLLSYIHISCSIIKIKPIIVPKDGK